MPLRAEEQGKKEGERHEDTDVSEKIEKHVIGGNVAVQKALDIDLPDTVKGGEVDEIAQIIFSLTLSRPDEVVASESLFEQCDVQKQIQVQEEEKEKKARQNTWVVRSLYVKESSEIEEQTDHKKEKDAQQNGAGKRASVSVKLDLKDRKKQKKERSGKKYPCFCALQKVKKTIFRHFIGSLPPSRIKATISIAETR